MTARRGEFHVTTGELEECKSKCRSCGAAVIFKPSTKRPKKGQAPKTMILSVATAQPALMGGHYLLSHFSDCPNAQKWRKG